nr:immunoglobulin heavy chain junction region [Mus musculus]MBK4198590.1 immunoglobulin heavy chain junction region [Mus musculus]
CAREDYGKQFAYW